MNIILIHDHFSPDHLAEVQSEMLHLGAPSIRAVWIECQHAWMALEGCHRIRAAAALGLEPEIVEIDFDEDTLLSEIGCLDAHGDDCTIGELADDAWRRHVVRLEDDC